MTTKNSPLRVLKAQADNIAMMVKAFERGEKIDVQFAEKLEVARQKEIFQFAIAMDDKILTIEMSWEIIRSTSEVGLAEYILDVMREKRRTIN